MKVGHDLKPWWYLYSSLQATNYKVYLTHKKTRNSVRAFRNMAESEGCARVRPVPAPWGACGGTNRSRRLVEQRGSHPHSIEVLFDP